MYITLMDVKYALLILSLFPLYVTVGGTWYTTYTSVPHYITSYSRSLMLESLEPAVFDTTDASTVAIEIDSDVIVGRIISGESLAIITKLAYNFDIGCF